MIKYKCSDPEHTTRYLEARGIRVEVEFVKYGTEISFEDSYLDTRNHEAFRRINDLIFSDEELNHILW